MESYIYFTFNSLGFHIFLLVECVDSLKVSAISISENPLDDPANTRPAVMPSSNSILNTAHDLQRVDEDSCAVQDGTADITSAGKTSVPSTVVCRSGQTKGLGSHLFACSLLQVNVLQLDSSQSLQEICPLDRALLTGNCISLSTGQNSQKGEEGSHLENCPM